MSTIRLLFLVLQLWFYPRRLRAEGSLTLERAMTMVQELKQAPGTGLSWILPKHTPKESPMHKTFEKQLRVARKNDLVLSHAISTTEEKHTV